MRSNSILARVVSLIILVLFTLLFFRYVDFYQETGEVLLTGGVLSTSNRLVTETLNQSPVNFPASLQGVLLENDMPKQTIHVSYTLPAPTGKYVRARVSLSVDNVQLGSVPEIAARAFIVSGQAGNWFWDVPHNIALLSGSVPLDDYSLVVFVPEDALNLRFSIQLARTTGSLLIDRVSLAIVEKDKEVERYVQGLMLLWLMLAIWVLQPLLSSGAGRFIVLLGVVLLSLVLMPVSYKYAFIDVVIAVLKQTELPKAWLNLVNLSIAGHFLMFLSLSLSALYLFKRHFLSVFFALLGVALLSEILQNFSVSRHPSLDDFAVDISGVLVAGVLVKLFNRKV